MLLFATLRYTAKKKSWFSTNSFEMEFVILDHCVKGRFCAQFGQKSLAPSSFDDRFKMHSICFAPFWLLLPFSTAHRQIRTFFFHFWKKKNTFAIVVWSAVSDSTVYSLLKSALSMIHFWKSIHSGFRLINFQICYWKKPNYFKTLKKWEIWIFQICWTSNLWSADTL